MVGASLCVNVKTLDLIVVRKEKSVAREGETEMRLEVNT